MPALSLEYPPPALPVDVMGEFGEWLQPIQTLSLLSVATGSNADIFASMFLSQNCPTRLEPIAEEVWAMVQPFGMMGLDAMLRMTVIRLADGTLFVHSPIDLTRECRHLIKAIGGPVSHIVIPNNSPEHWYFVPQWALVFPEANIHVAPGLQRHWSTNEGMFGEVRVHAVLSDAAPAEWSSEIEQALLDDPLFKEVVFHHRPSGVLLTSDTAFAIEDGLLHGSNEFTQFAAQSAAEIAGVRNKLGCPGFVKVALELNHPELERWVKRVMSWDFELIVPAHGTAPVQNGREAFRQAFQFVWES